MDSVLFQAGLALPLILFLTLFASGRRSDPVARHLFVLLLLILSWVVGMVIDLLANGDSSLDAWVGLLVFPPSAFMAPVFLLMMLHYARVEAFTERPIATVALLAPFVLFLLAFATNDWHGAMLRPGISFVRAQPFEDARALFWTFQIWSNLVAAAGVMVCFQVAYRDPGGAERRRMALVAAAGLIPIVAHWTYTARLLPIEVPLTPAALAVSSILVTVAVRQYRLLDVQPVARRDVIEASDDGVVIADASGRIVDCNAAMTRLLDGDRSSLLGLPLERIGDLLQTKSSQPSMRDWVLRTMRDAEPVHGEVETGDGRILEVSVRPVRLRDGALAGSFAVLRDRSQERRAQLRVQHGRKLESVGILAAGFAHEINNPLAYVCANLAHLRQAAEVFEDHAVDLPQKVQDEIAEFIPIVDETLDGLERIQNIVRGLLHFAARNSTAPAASDVNEAISIAARFASFGNALQWEADLDPALPKTSIPQDQLIQVFLNLLLNARNAVEDRADPAIAVTSRAADGAIVVRVEDNGPGVPEPIRDKIFDLFFTTRAPDEGTGLGLSIAHDILHEYEGSLELDPDYEAGAAFVVRLPIFG